MPNQIFTGLLPDPEDNRDLILTLPDIMSAIGQVPKVFFVQKDIIKVLSQGNEPICVGCAGEGLEYIWQTAYSTEKFFPASTLYDSSREYYPPPPPPRGSCLRYLMKVFRKEGVIQRYHKIEPKAGDFLETFTAAIAFCQGIPFSILNFGYDQASGLIYFESPGIGGHALLAIGYDERFVYFVNSWGKEWGDWGFGKISHNDLKKCIMNVWAYIVTI